MTQIIWDPNVRQFLKKLPKEIAKRIFKKVDLEISINAERYLKNLINFDANKIRIGDYRLFVDYYKKEDKLIIRSIKHRKNAYKI